MMNFIDQQSHRGNNTGDELYGSNGCEVASEGKRRVKSSAKGAESFNKGSANGIAWKNHIVKILKDGR